MNLLSMLQDTLTDGIMDKAAGFLGEDAGKTAGAFGAALPTILGKVADMGASESGAGSLLNMINDKR